jgi:hypothetical protein
MKITFMKTRFRLFPLYYKVTMMYDNEYKLKLQIFIFNIIINFWVKHNIVKD